MAKNIPGSSATYPANVRCPTTGDAVDQPAWENGLTDLANRTAFLTAQVASGGTGVVTVRSVANPTTMKALTGMVAGDLCTVRGTGRIYVFQATEPQITDAGDSFEPFAYVADDATGYWYAAPDTPSVMLVDEQFIAVDDIDTAQGTYMVHTGTTDWTDLTDTVDPMVVTLTGVMEGDMVEVMGRFQSIGDGAGNGSAFRATARYGGVDFGIHGSGVYQIGNVVDPATQVCFGRYIMPSAQASVDVVLQVKLALAGGTVGIGDTSVTLQAKLYRKMAL